MEQTEEQGIYVNCNFTYNYPTQIIPMKIGPPKTRIESDQDWNIKLIEFIQEKIDLPLPKETLEAILKAETEFLSKYE